VPKIYTKYGDDGDTGLLYGGRVSKADLRCEAYGTVDEAISSLGLARSLAKSNEIKPIIKEIQEDLFTIGAELATDLTQYDLLVKHFRITTNDMISKLEQFIDSLNDQLTLPRQFIIPGGSPASGALDLSRSIIRRAERRVVSLKDMDLLKNSLVLKYLNRSADLIFIMARFEDKDLPIESLTSQRS
tara:strand:+ start:312 stop:872 length:561 start_codon:yes stop_codon:yes gene_type:complete